jgi:uncharacterized protein (DUF58 family)
VIPWLTPGGLTWFGVASLLAVFGVVHQLPLAVLSAELLLAALAASYLVGARAASALACDGLTLQLAPKVEGPSWARGDQVGVTLSLHNRSDAPLHHISLHLAESSGVVWRERTIRVGSLEPGARARLDVEATAARSGRWALHGAEVRVGAGRGAVQTSAWLTSDAVVQIAPRIPAAHGRTASERNRSLRRLGAGVHQTSRRGDGIDLRHLREHAPGDGLRRVAWKATARRGRLMVRQHEDEVVRSSVLVVEASGALRGGDGAAMLEWVIGFGGVAAAACSESRDRLGSHCFDERGLAALAAAQGRTHYGRVERQIQALATPFAPGATEADDAQVIRNVVAHLFAHDRVDFRRARARRRTVGPFAPVDEEVDVDGFERWALARFSEPLGHARRYWEDAGYAFGTWSPARQLAAALGVELTPRGGGWAPRRAERWRAAMERAHVLTKQPSTVVLVAQVSGMQDAASLRDGVLALRERGHRPVLISLHEERFLAAEGTMPEVTALLVDHAVRERALVERAIADVGIPVVPAHRASSPAAVWHAAHAQAALRHR